MEWMYEAVGEMITSAPQLERLPDGADFVEALHRFAAQVVKGNLAELGLRIGMKPHTVRQWARGRYRPRFDSLLDLCYRINTTPVKLLYGSFSGHSVSMLRSSSPDIKRRIRKSKHPKLDKTQAEKMLKKFLGWKRPCAISKAAEKLNCIADTLRYHFPELCREIAKKRRERREALKAAK